MSSWDPSDLLDFLDTKKKLPGDRKPVFPEGVPGLEQGVPKDLYKGRGRSRRSAERRSGGRRGTPPEEPKSKRGAKSAQRHAGATASRAPAPAPAAADARRGGAEEGSTAAAPPPPSRSEDRAAGARTAPPPDPPHNSRRHRSNNRFAIPGTDAERQLLALIVGVLNTVIDTPLPEPAHGIAYVFHHCHHRPAQCRKIDAVQPAGRAEARAGR